MSLELDVGDVVVVGVGVAGVAGVVGVVRVEGECFGVTDVGTALVCDVGLDVGYFSFLR